MVGGFDDPSVEAEHRALFAQPFERPVPRTVRAGVVAGRAFVWLVAFLVVCAVVVVGSFAAALAWHLIRIGWGLA